MALKSLLSNLRASDEQPETAWDKLRLTQEDLEEPAPPSNPAPLIGPDLDSVAQKLRKGVDASTHRLEEIEAEIERLKTERAKTSVVLKTYESALKMLSQGATQEGVPLSLPEPPKGLTPFGELVKSDLPKATPFLQPGEA